MIVILAVTKMIHKRNKVIKIYWFAGKYDSNYKKHRFKIVDKPERQPKQIFLHEDIGLEVIK